MQSCGNGVGCEVLATLGWSVGPWFEPVSELCVNMGERMPALWPSVAGAFGAVVASLSGLLVDRIPRMNGWGARPPEPGLTLARPASHCEGCGHPIAPLALVPVAGWFMTRGRCEPCGATVPWIYPAVEGGVALLFMGFVVAFGASMASLLGCLAMSVLVLVSWLDWEEQVIPDSLSLPLFFGGLLASPFEPDVWSRGAGALATGACIWTAFKFVSSVKKVDAMATGDIALGTALGAWVGFCAMPAFVLIAMAAYLAYALPLRLKDDRLWVPMGPALSVGFVAVVLTGIKFNI